MTANKSAMLLNPMVNSPILGERKNNAATQTIESAHGVAEKQSKGTTYLVNQKADSVKAFKAAAQALRETVYAYSFPFGDGKVRLSTVKAFPKLQKAWKAGVNRLDDAAENYFSDYPALMAQAESQLGSLYDATQYPSIEELRRAYKVRLDIWPLPESGHFVADLSDEAVREAKAGIEQTYKESLESSFKLMADKSEKLVTSFIEKLESHGRDEKTGKMAGIFRDTLISNISDQASLIRDLNFTNEAGIETMAVHLDRLAKVTGESLRDDPALRASKVTEAKSLLAKLDSFRKVDSEIANIIGSVAEYM